MAGHKKPGLGDVASFVFDDDDGVMFGGAPPPAPPATKKRPKAAASEFMDEVVQGLGSTAPKQKRPKVPKILAVRAEQRHRVAKAKAAARASIRAFAKTAETDAAAKALLTAANAWAKGPDGTHKKTKVNRAVKLLESMGVLLQKDP